MTSIRLPAEWENQSALLLTWPIDLGLWKEHLPDVTKIFTQIAIETSAFQPVIISCFDESHKYHIQQCLNAYPTPQYDIHFYIVPSNDSWTRDHGPITLFKNQKAFLRKFVFNGWGNKYTHALDNQVVDQLAQLHAFEPCIVEHSNWVLEGGSIETDGQHTLLTTESCLLNKNRNPQLTQKEIEQRLRQDLGIERILWIKNSFLAGDDTDGHIDMLARFCNPETICYTTPHPENQADQKSLLGLAEELQDLRTANGQPYRLVPLPPIQPKWNKQGEQMPASYANFLVINHAVLVPTYEDVNDTAALDCLQKCFPNRQMIPIPALGLIQNHGSVHCSTMNLYIQ